MKRLALFSLVLPLLLLGYNPAEAALGDYFVDTAWLAQHRQEVKIVDVRVTPLYLLGHLDDAVSIQKEEFLSTRGGVKSLVPTVAEFEALMVHYGITPDTPVVAYAEDDNPYAARFVWMLKFHGHEKAYVLDGGYQKWAQEKRPTAFLPTEVVASRGYHCRDALDIRAEVDYVLTRLGNPGVTIWDTRKPSEYDGSEVRADRGGHIPGAVHLNWVSLLKEVDGAKVLKDEKEIRAMLAAAGISPQREIVAHCQTGIRSSYATLVLLGLGYRAQNYDGSWIEWANNKDLPVETVVRTAARSGDSRLQ